MTPKSPKDSFLRRRHGTLTRDLVQEHGKFGLGRLPLRLSPDDTTNVVCGFCSTGCGLKIHLRNKQAINVTPTPDYPVNLGMACPKGWEALTPLHASDRATTPLLRNHDGTLVPIDWDAAMQTFALRFKAIQDQHGEDSIAWLGTGQIVTEELAFLGALAKFGMGMIHGDGNTRQCMATAVAAYKESLGFDAPPYTYADLEESDVLVFVGSNLCIAHPILWQRVLRNKNRPEIVVIDPRKTETAMAATQHLALYPKSDLSLLYGLARILIENNWIDRAFIDGHTSHFPEFAQHVQSYTLDRVTKDTALPAQSIEHLAQTIRSGKRVSFWWTMGVNQGHEATRTAQAIINLALLTGNIGRPGTGANSITGQCNAMGSRLFSNTTNLLGGHDFTNPAHRSHVARILEIPIESIPARNSWSYDQIVDGIASQKIKGLWIVATNSAHSWINQTAFKKILQSLDFLVVQDIYHSTETARLAHLLLPAAAWGEKNGTFINSERRFGLVKKISKSPGEALSDFSIFKLAAHYWGCGDMFKNWTSPEAVFQILKKLSADRPCDFTAIRDYRMLEEAGGVQWPWPLTETNRQDNQSFFPETERRLFADGRFFHPDGRARFVFAQTRPMTEPPCKHFPYLLLTGRGSSAQWHTQTRTGKSEVLRTLYPEGVYAEINHSDAVRLQIQTNDRIAISSRRGRIEAQALVTFTVQPLQIFVPMHYEETNRLTFPSFDPHSRQPSYKACAVTIAKIESPLR